MTTHATSDILARDPRRIYWVETANPALEARSATHYALANGYLGVRGTHEEMPSWATPGFYVAGTYCAAPGALIPIHTADHILTHPERVKPEHHAGYTELTTMPNLPNPVAIRLTIGEELIDLDTVRILACERIMHMPEARVTRRLVIRDRAGRRTIIDSERFASWENPRLVSFRYRVTPDGHAAPIRVEPYIHTGVTNARGLRLFTVTAQAEEPGINTVSVQLAKPAQQVNIAQAYQITDHGASVVVDVVISADQGSGEANVTAADGMARGFDALRAAHLEAVAAAYHRGGVEVTADLLTEQGTQFGIMQLEMALCRDNPTVSVPIKGLTGEGYRFLVFWDTDFHMFPYYLLTNPSQARNLILYRCGQLDAYRRNARAWGYRGAQVPWETGTTGEEETAPWLCLQERELHITADAAYMVKLYDDLVDDASLLVDHGAELVFEAARFYASRVTWQAEAGRYELLDVGCPDQYHTFADNNVFISRMAKWNLAYAAELAGDARLAGVRAKIGLDDAEAAQFQTIADALYVIPPNAEGIIEECDGFLQLSTDLRGISESYCSHTQAVKQPDVVALFQPFTEEYSREVMQKNWRFYEARTIHGSSLSLPGMALAAAVAGLPDKAAGYFQRSSRMDLDDINLNANLGVHLAGYAVLWETLVYGFGGLTPRRDRLDFAPCLPRGWDKVAFAVVWRGCRLAVDLRHGALTLTADADNPRAIPVRVQGGEMIRIEPGQEEIFRID